MKTTFRFAALAIFFVSCHALAELFTTIELSMGIYRIEAEVAITESQRQRGLMFRESMPDNHGMLFVSPSLRTECMWMKNTLLPLSVAFVDDGGRIVNVEEMQPQTVNRHCSAKPVRYVLEMNSGWFAQRGFGPGTELQGLERVSLSH